MVRHREFVRELRHNQKVTILLSFDGRATSAHTIDPYRGGVIDGNG